VKAETVVSLVCGLYPRFCYVVNCGSFIDLGNTDLVDFGKWLCCKRCMYVADATIFRME